MRKLKMKIGGESGASKEQARRIRYLLKLSNMSRLVKFIRHGTRIISVHHENRIATDFFLYVEESKSPHRELLYSA